MSTEAQTELERIESNVAAAYAAAEEQGADMPEAQTTDNLAETVGSIKSVKFTEQTLTDDQKAQARANIGAASQESIVFTVTQDKYRSMAQNDFAELYTSGVRIISVTDATGSIATYTNLVPTSTDTDGSIYNGVGYKDDVRLSSSGDVSGTAQAGSVTTGFIPCKHTDIIRMKGAKWLGFTASEGHYYIIFYNDAKTKVAGYSPDVVNSSYAGVSVEYDETTGVTTWDISEGPSNYAENVKSAAYFRINAYGKGADLIVTVNEEI